MHPTSLEVAIAEIKVWNVPCSVHYPEGLKYSLFLVSRESGQVILGFDNHKPKGPHLHYQGKELTYLFLGIDQLIDDFWKRTEKEGFKL